MCENYPMKILGFIFDKKLILPISLLVFYLLFLALAKSVIPTGQELIADFERIYLKFGYEIVLAAAFLESLVVVNLFVPGQVAMVMGIVFARTGQMSLPGVLLSAVVGALLGYSLDYALGRFGFAEIIERTGHLSLVQNAKKQLDRFGKKGLVVGFAHTNIGALLSLAAGISEISIKTFSAVAVLATFFWAVVWSILIYLSGEVILIIISRYAFLLFFLVVIWMILSRIRKN